MENKENKIKAVKLSDDELENVSGGEAVRYNCCACGELLTDMVCISNGKQYCMDCFGAAQDA